MSDITGLGAIRNLDDTILLCDDLARMRAFYSDVEAAAQQLSAAGVEFLEPVTDQQWGHRTLFFADPENNVIEIYADI